MSISCECNWDSPGFYVSHERRARVEHFCTECGIKIQPGEDYRHISGKWDGVVDTFKMCEKCSDLWDSMLALGFCLEHGYLLEDHRDYIAEYNPPRLTE